LDFDNLAFDILDFDNLAFDILDLDKITQHPIEEGT
jgi:hypothetical protein